MPWSLRLLPNVLTPVGPCAWRASMLLEHGTYLREHPSLMVTHPDDPIDLLARIGPRISAFHVMLSIREPQFSRRIPDAITQRVAALGVASVEFVALHVEDPTDLKSGASFQYLYELRDKGVFKHIALAHPDIRMVEWLSQHTPAPAILMPYGLGDQSARHRALTSAYDNGMVPLAVGPCWFSSEPKVPSIDSIRFSLAESPRILPVFDSPIAEGVEPMSILEVEAAWQDYSSVNSAPEPLPRSLPPE